MTGRAAPEWIGATPDTPAPPRVRARIFTGRCAACTRRIAAGEVWHADHITALTNGGQNRENNLQPLCAWCHKQKTRADVAEKSRVAEKRAKHIGAKAPSRNPVPGGRASKWKRKISGEVVLR